MTSVRKMVREVSVWAVAVFAAALSFHYFEDAYRAIGKNWPLLVATDARAPIDITGSVNSPAPGKNTQPPAPPTSQARPRLIIDATSWKPIVVEQAAEPKSVALQANAYGHFHVEAQINGKPVELMTDTGATYVALSYEAAIKLGYTSAALKFSGRSSTANGIARVAPVTLEAVRIGDIEIRNVAAVVAEAGKMNQNLLGMSFIKMLSKFELRGDRLVLIQ
ncbi:MAG: TIGR02281 family clan AA aspartic protease [Chitinophagales bacterium]|nr:TIGR02281 family clan AA aspartic protease [Hyphomicrobiales bacterium]